MISYILLFFAGSFAEWVENNIFEIVSALLGGVGAIIWLIRLENSVKNMCDKVVEIDEKIEEMQQDFVQHTKDKDAHVNHLYMAAFKERLIKLETTVETGQQMILAKIDSLTEKIYRNTKC
jgi:hypothetical protein